MHVPPTIIITMGDRSGIGPEIIVKGWPEITKLGTIVVVGDPAYLQAALDLLQAPLTLRVLDEFSFRFQQENFSSIPIYNPCESSASVQWGIVNAENGRCAYEYLLEAIDRCKQNVVQALVTCPLHKEALHRAGVPFPGHTEILASRTGAVHHAMLLHDAELPLTVAHVTLHQSLKSIFSQLNPKNVFDKILLLHQIIPELLEQPARIAVSALNPHASDGGLFGDEEETVLRPALEQALNLGIQVQGPIAADAIFLPHYRRNYNSVVCLYHDQGHIAMKLLGGRRAVNVTAGLPIVRTSVAHGTAFDIAGTGQADASSLIAAVRVAAVMVRNRQRQHRSSIPPFPDSH